MKKLLQALTEAFGPSGYEDEVRELIHREVKSLADEIRVDALGNLIAHKYPRKDTPDTKKIMVAAHMDEIGLMVSHVDQQGFARFSPIGNVCNRYIPGGRVRFRNGMRGVLGFDRPDRVNEPPALDQIYIDTGAARRSECPVKIGDVAVFDQPYHEFGDRLVARSMNDRVGVLVAIESLRKLKSAPHSLAFVFTTQAEMGAGAAAASAHGLDPDAAIALEVTPASDTPMTDRTELALGKGPCIQIQAAGMIAHPRVMSWMVAAAEKHKLPYQREVRVAGDSDAGRIQQSRGGVPSGRISVPVRYIHSSSEMVDYLDVQNAVKLLTAVLHTPVGL